MLITIQKLLRWPRQMIIDQTCAGLNLVADILDNVKATQPSTDLVASFKINNKCINSSSHIIPRA